MVGLIVRRRERRWALSTAITDQSSWESLGWENSDSGLSQQMLMVVAASGLSDEVIHPGVVSATVRIDSMPQDNKLENYIHMWRFTDMLSTLGPRLRSLPDGGFDRIGLVEGLRYEASLAAVLSGTLAIRGLAIYHIPHDLPPDQSVQAAVQRFAYKDPDSGLALLARTWSSGQFTAANINAIYQPVSHTTWADEADELLQKVFKHEWRGPDTYWWRSQRPIDPQTSATAKSGMAAHLYLNAEPFISQRTCGSAPSTSTPASTISSAVTLLETLLGQIHSLRQELVQQQGSLTNMCVDQELHFAATYSALYDGVPDSGSDHLDAIIGGLGLIGDREHIRSLIENWTR
ncbi:unnamed protein product [Peniophora sp. CBMAI 1063]|nr:unnamed protein product [Peniophora sp. CBMAI 1063]